LLPVPGCYEYCSEYGRLETGLYSRVVSHFLFVVLGSELQDPCLLNRCFTTQIFSPPVSAFGVLGLHVCTTMPSRCLFLFHLSKYLGIKLLSHAVFSFFKKLPDYSTVNHFTLLLLKYEDKLNSFYEKQVICTYPVNPPYLANPLLYMPQICPRETQRMCQNTFQEY
jgi:hypothetical protein